MFLYQWFTKNTYSRISKKPHIHLIYTKTTTSVTKSPPTWNLIRETSFTSFSRVKWGILRHGINCPFRSLCIFVSSVFSVVNFTTTKAQRTPKIHRGKHPIYAGAQYNHRGIAATQRGIYWKLAFFFKNVKVYLDNNFHSWLPMPWTLLYFYCMNFL